MNKRSASLLVLVVLASLLSLGFDSQRNPATTSKRSARANVSAARKSAAPPAAAPTNIGFLSPGRNAANGAIFGIFPAVMGDFAGTGSMDAASFVNTSPGSHVYNISAAMNSGTGSFSTVLTPTTEVQQDPLFVGDMNGDGKDDIVLIHPADSPGHTYVQVWLSTGTGTFAAVNNGVSVTTNGFVWATIADVNGDGCPDVVAADAATPNGNIWTLLGKGDGTCDGSLGAPTSVPFTGALSAFGTSNNTGVPGNPIVFADFNGDGYLDFAGAAASGGTAARNQIVEYLCNSGTSPCTSYAAPALLANTNTTYDSCYLGSGNLSTATGPPDLVAANCIDGNVTVYVNSAGTFATGVYYAAGAKPAAVSVADVNADGNGDIVVTDLNSSAIRVLLGAGNGTVGAASPGYVTGGAPLMPALIAPFGGSGTAVGVVVPDNETNFVYLSGYGDGTFRSGINYYSSPTGGGYEPEGVGLASGDFNGDGYPDIVIGNASCVPSCEHAPITVFLSNPDGSMQPGVNYSPNSGKYMLQFVAVADYNGDGKLDIAASDTVNGVIQVFLGNGDGTFQQPVSYPAGAAGAYTVGIVTADFNGDGKPDLAFVNNFGTISAPTSANVGVLINNGAGGFNTVVNTPNLSNVATELTAADLNGDGKLDLTVPLYGQCSAGTCSVPGSAVAILLGNGDGTFQAESDFQLTNNGTSYLNPYYAAIGDINGDGKPDLAVTIQSVSPSTGQGIAVALGNGDGTFQTPTLLSSSPQNPAFASPPLPGYVRMVDLNQDGNLDLVYTNALQGTVAVLYGQGNGTFYDPVDFAASRWAWDFALADVNGDGVPDVVTTGFEQNFSGVGVLLNTSASATSLKSSAPNSTTGQAVTFTATITGTTVRGATYPTPTGTMTFFDGSTQLGQPVAISSGSAAITISTLAAGTHSITANYSGDANYVPTISAAVQQVVVQGVAPDYTLTPNPTTKTVSPGTSATYAIAVAAVNGYNGTVSFPASACAGLPTGSTCSFSPTSITGSGTTTLTVTTTAPTSSLMSAPDVNQHRGNSNLWASLAGVGMLGMVLAGDWKKRNRRALGIVLLVIALAMVLALVGCGGGSNSGSGGGGGGGGTGGTPAGSYAIKLSVTGTAGTNGGSTAAHTASVTLVVN
jgi:hypothetical protein